MSKQTPAKLMRSPSYFNLVHPYVGETHSNSDFTSFSGMYRNYQQHVSWSAVSTPARRQSSALSASKETKVIVQNRNYHALSQANILPIHAQRTRGYNFNNARYARRRYIIQQQQQQPAREEEDEKDDEEQRETLEKEQSSMDGNLLVVDSNLTESQSRLQNNNSNNNNNNSNNTTTVTPITVITTASTAATNKESEQLRNDIEIIPLASVSTFFAELTDAENVKSNNANANANAAVVDAVGKSSNISVLEKATTTTPTTRTPTQTQTPPQIATPTSRQIQTNNEMIVHRSFPMFEILPSLITSKSKKQSLLYQNSYLLDGIKYENNINNKDNNKNKQSQTKSNVNANKNQEQHQNIQKNSKLKLDYKKYFKSRE